MRKKKAIMIGAGLANMAGAVYLIQEGNWDGKDITFYALDTHGANDGSTASEAAEEYWNKNGKYKGIYRSWWTYVKLSYIR